MIRIAVCDDEVFYRKQLIQLIGSNKPTEEISIFEFESGSALLEAHQEMPFSIVFLDIEMPEQNGIGFLLAYYFGEEVCGELDSASVFVQTKIPALDAVLSAKLAKAAKDNIQLSYQVSIPCLHIDQVEFSILIANALNNAIEACQRMEPSSNNRFVDLKIGTSGLYLICKIKNASPSNGQTLRTWKEDKENHGLGLESMKKNVKNYDGSMTLEGKNGMFFTSIMLKNN